MKKTLATLVGAVLLSIAAFAQHGNHGNKPAATGIEHAETKANANGDKGIENAEAKQEKHKKGKTTKTKHSHTKKTATSTSATTPAPKK
jgi:hypothetical protein